jgi:hypothetical protein
MTNSTLNSTLRAFAALAPGPLYLHDFGGGQPYAVPLASNTFLFAFYGIARKGPNTGRYVQNVFEVPDNFTADQLQAAYDESLKKFLDFENGADESSLLPGKVLGKMVPTGRGNEQRLAQE